MQLSDVLGLGVLAMMLGLVILGWVVVCGWRPDNSKELSKRRRKELLSDYNRGIKVGEEEHQRKILSVRDAYLKAVRDIAKM